MYSTCTLYMHVCTITVICFEWGAKSTLHIFKDFQIKAKMNITCTRLVCNSE